MAYRLTPAALRQKWAEYSKKCDTGFTETVRYRDGVVEVPKRLIYNIDSFCCFAGIPDGRLDVLEKNKNYRKMVKTIKYVVRARKMDALVNGEGSCNGLIFDLKSNYGLYPKRAGDAPDKGWGVTLNVDETPDKGGPDDKSAPAAEGETTAATEKEAPVHYNQERAEPPLPVQPPQPPPPPPGPPAKPAFNPHLGYGQYSIW